MKISVDTNEDSKEHIRHAISMLQKLIGDNREEIASNSDVIIEDKPKHENIFDAASIPPSKEGGGSGVKNGVLDDTPVLKVPGVGEEEGESEAEPETAKESSGNVFGNMFGDDAGTSVKADESGDDSEEETEETENKEETVTEEEKKAASEVQIVDL